jgi:protein gp37
LSPECSGCYAEAMDRRTGGDHWGVHTSPKALSDDNWRKPFAWNKAHDAFAQINGGRRRRVFSASMGDIFAKNAPHGQRERYWQMVKQTPNLTHQVLTKLAPNIKRMLPADWGDGYDNVWLGVSVGNRKHGLPRIDHLRDIPARVRFLSIEPLLEDLGTINLDGIHWVIVGGESGALARKMDPAWVHSIRGQCAEAKVPFFFKQWGGRTHDKGGCLIEGVEVKEWPSNYDH